MAKRSFFFSDIDDAERQYEQAISIFTNSLGPSHPELADALTGLAEVRWWNGDLPATRDLLERASEIEERQISLILSGSTEIEARAFMRTVSRSTERILSLQPN